MELYHRQLKGIKDLRQEKRRLKRADVQPSVPPQDARSEDISMSDIAGSIAMSNGTLDALMGLAMPLFRVALRKTEKGLLKKVAKEVLGGYLKWKSIDLGLTLAMRFIRMQKHKADKEHHNC